MRGRHDHIPPAASAVRSRSPDPASARERQAGGGPALLALDVDPHVRIPGGGERGGCLVRVAARRAGAVHDDRRPAIDRRVTTVAFAIYASPGYLARIAVKRELGKHISIAPDDSLATTTIARWMARTIPQARIALRSDTLSALAHAAAAGVGVAALPCYLGDPSFGLRRVRGVIPDMATELWVLTHEDLKATVRVRAAADALVAGLREWRELFQGRRAAP
jgi:DNA-binding transcriptional LysR family regulator